MSRTPIAIRPRSYRGAKTVADVMAWFDEIADDQARVLETNLIAAVQDGDLEDVDAAADALVVAQEMVVEARAQFHRQVQALIPSRGAD